MFVRTEEHGATLPSDEIFSLVFEKNLRKHICKTAAGTPRYQHVLLRVRTDQHGATLPGDKIFLIQI